MYDITNYLDISCELHTYKQAISKAALYHTQRLISHNNCKMHLEPEHLTLSQPNCQYDRNRMRNIFRSVKIYLKTDYMKNRYSEA